LIQNCIAGENLSGERPLLANDTKLKSLIYQKRPDGGFEMSVNPLNNSFRKISFPNKESRE
jgi:hypothetical protein